MMMPLNFFRCKVSPKITEKDKQSFLFSYKAGFGREKKRFCTLLTTKQANDMPEMAGDVL
jgi:hypothetical protein